MIFINAGNRCE